MCQNVSKVRGAAQEGGHFIPLGHHRTNTAKGTVTIGVEVSILQKGIRDYNRTSVDVYSKMDIF